LRDGARSLPVCTACRKLLLVSNFEPTAPKIFRDTFKATDCSIIWGIMANLDEGWLQILGFRITCIGKALSAAWQDSALAFRSAQGPLPQKPNRVSSVPDRTGWCRWPAGPKRRPHPFCPPHGSCTVQTNESNLRTPSAECRCSVASANTGAPWHLPEDCGPCLVVNCSTNRSLTARIGTGWRVFFPGWLDRRLSRIGPTHVRCACSPGGRALCGRGAASRISGLAGSRRARPVPVATGTPPHTNAALV